VAATYFHSFPFTGDRTKEKVADLARRLARWQGEVELRVVPFTALQKALAGAGGERENRLAVVLYRRAMLRIAERLARARGALGLVTGDALGQVASQTLVNLGVIGEVTTLPLLRPLIAHDKLETVAVAKRIGTYDLSIAPYEDCCSLFLPDHPETQAKAAAVRALEAKIADLAALEQACVDGVERIACR
jgi:thiamine biosynthesis protein ThiI